MTDPTTGINLLIIARESREIARLTVELDARGFVCTTVPYGEVEKIVAQPPADIIIVEVEDNLAGDVIRKVASTLQTGHHVPVIALVSRRALDNLNGQIDIDDFITGPYHAAELSLRIRRLLHVSRGISKRDLIQYRDLAIDPDTCEVTLAGRIVELTFKEYELLKLLASNRGRVYTREALLDKIWGYDYYGGDRTVDVHMRRLRSKIEDATHNYIETVRNIGYRFRKET